MGVIKNVVNNLVKYHNILSFSKQKIAKDTSYLFYPFVLWLFVSIVMKIAGMDVHELVYTLPLILSLISVLVYYIYGSRLHQSTNMAIMACIVLLSMPIIAIGILNHLDLSVTGKEQNWVSFQSVYGKNWEVVWNDFTGAPDIVFGSAYDVRINKSEEIQSADVANTLAIKFISDNSGLLKISNVSDLDLKNIDHRFNNWYITYQQYYKGISVYRGEVGVTISEQGNITSFGSDFYPGINLPIIPMVSKEKAIELVKNELPVNTATVENISLEVFPKINNGLLSYHLSWRVRVISWNPLYNYDYFVDAYDGDILRKANLILSEMQISGNVTGQIWPQQPSDALMTRNFSKMYVYIKDGGGHNLGLNPYITSTDGAYHTTDILNLNSIVNLSAHSEGPYVKVIDGATGQSMEHSYDFGFVSDKEMHDWDWGIGDMQNVFYHTNVAHDYFASPPIDYNLNRQILAKVNTGFDDEGWSSGTIMGFGNKLWLQWARASSVIYHEYSHNVIWNVYGKRFIGNSYDDDSEASAMDEGLADYFASSLLNNPLHGIEGYSGLYSRNLDNDLLYSDWGSDPHYNGMIISGALWHLRQSVGNRTADRLIFRSLQRTPHPDTFLELYFYLLREDDDNNNIRDGTPNKANIDNAFKRHGIIKDA